MKFLLKYPSRNRPDIFQSQIRKWMKTSSKKHDLKWVFTFDRDDVLMTHESVVQGISEAMGGHADFVVKYMEPQGKIAACNAHVNEHLTDDIDILCLISDDMIPSDDWDRKIANLMKNHFPDGDGAIHINDGLQGKNLITFSCMGLKLYKRFMYFYHPDYVSCFSDNEFTEIVYSWKKVFYTPEVIVKHHWVGNYHPDSLHMKNHDQMFRDQPTWIKRRNAGYPLKSVLS